MGASLLIVAGVMILGLVVFAERRQTLRRQAPRDATGVPRQLAPRFELADHRRQLVKFERFLGRQRVVVVFFDGSLGAARDPRLLSLIENFNRIDAAGIKIIAISAATPFANREAEKQLGSIPFPLLTDIDIRTPIPDPVHRLWGRYDESQRQRLTGVFLVDRDGTVPVGSDGKPLPVENEATVLEILGRGEWPPAG